MKAAGIKFICNTDVGKDISGKELEKRIRPRDSLRRGLHQEISMCPAGDTRHLVLRWIFWEL